jgi:hypothetical protein
MAIARLPYELRLELPDTTKVVDAVSNVLKALPGGMKPQVEQIGRKQGWIGAQDLHPLYMGMTVRRQVERILSVHADLNMMIVQVPGQPADQTYFHTQPIDGKMIGEAVTALKLFRPRLIDAVPTTLGIKVMVLADDRLQDTLKDVRSRLEKLGSRVWYLSSITYQAPDNPLIIEPEKEPEAPKPYQPLL